MLNASVLLFYPFCNNAHNVLNLKTANRNRITNQVDTKGPSLKENPSFNLSGTDLSSNPCNVIDFETRSREGQSAVTKFTYKFGIILI